jgi:hypothetical protein
LTIAGVFYVQTAICKVVLRPVRLTPEGSQLQVDGGKVVKEEFSYHMG